MYLQDKAEAGEALLVRNTFMNTQIKGVDKEKNSVTPQPKPSTRIKWKDQLVEIISDFSNNLDNLKGRYDDTPKLKSKSDFLVELQPTIKDLKRKNNLIEQKTSVMQPPINDFTFQSVENVDQSQDVPKQKQFPQQQHQEQQQQQQVQYNINLNVSQLNIINPSKVKSNNFTLSTPKFSENNNNSHFDQLSNYLSNQPRPKDSAYNKSRSHSQGFRNQHTKTPQSFQQKIQRNPQQVEINRSITPEPAQKHQVQTPNPSQQLFEIYLENAPLNNIRQQNQFFDSTKATRPKIRPRQLTPIQIKNQSLGPIRSVSQNTKAQDIEIEDYSSNKPIVSQLGRLNGTVRNLRGREKKFQIRK